MERTRPQVYIFPIFKCRLKDVCVWVLRCLWMCVRATCLICKYIIREKCIGIEIDLEWVCMLYVYSSWLYSGSFNMWLVVVVVVWLFGIGEGTTGWVWCWRRKWTLRDLYVQFVVGEILCLWGDAEYWMIIGLGWRCDRVVRVNDMTSDLHTYYITIYIVLAVLCVCVTLLVFAHVWLQIE